MSRVASPSELSEGQARSLRIDLCRRLVDGVDHRKSRGRGNRVRPTQHEAIRHVASAPLERGRVDVRVLGLDLDALQRSPSASLFVRFFVCARRGVDVEDSCKRDDALQEVRQRLRGFGHSRDQGMYRPAHLA